MSTKHPIIAVTGSSGAGTTSVAGIFQQIFRREGLNAAFVEGDSFHRYDRTEMAERIAAEALAGNHAFSHFGPEANLFAELEELFRSYAAEEAGAPQALAIRRGGSGQPPGTFTPWRIWALTDLLFYEGSTAAWRPGVSMSPSTRPAHRGRAGHQPRVDPDPARQVDRAIRRNGHRHDLRRMPDYVHAITPQFTRTHINFQRVPVVDTSTIARFIPTLDEYFVVIASGIPGTSTSSTSSRCSTTVLSRPNTLVCPAGRWTWRCS